MTTTGTTEHYDIVRERLADLIEVHAGQGDTIAYAPITDDDDADDLIEQIRGALAPDYVVDWTGNGNGDKMDIAIELARQEG